MPWSHQLSSLELNDLVRCKSQDVVAKPPELSEKSEACTTLVEVGKLSELVNRSLKLNDFNDVQYCSYLTLGNVNLIVGNQTGRTEIYP